MPSLLLLALRSELRGRSTVTVRCSRARWLRVQGAGEHILCPRSLRTACAWRARGRSGSCLWIGIAGSSRRRRLEGFRPIAILPQRDPRGNDGGPCTHASQLDPLGSVCHERRRRGSIPVCEEIGGRDSCRGIHIELPIEDFDGSRIELPVDQVEGALRDARAQSAP